MKHRIRFCVKRQGNVTETIKTLIEIDGDKFPSRAGVVADFTVVRLQKLNSFLTESHIVGVKDYSYKKRLEKLGHTRQVIKLIKRL